ncbi:hypothetical protein EV356DRAFT_477061, partial [Viridothelium virens]
MGSISTQDPWLQARNLYMKDLNEEEQKVFETASLENLLDSTNVARKSHEEQSRMRNISRKLEPFVNAICQFGEALDVFSNTYAIAMAPLWGSVRVLLHIAKGFQKYFKNITDMLTRIGDNLPRCRIYYALFPAHGRLLQAISVVYLDIIHFCIDAKAIFRELRDPKISFLYKRIWKTFDVKFQENILGKFRKSIENMEKEVKLSHMIETSQDREVLRREKDEAERQRMINYRHLLLKNLSSQTYIDKHIKERRKRFPGTGKWLTQSNEVQDWKNRETSDCLWRSGIPGSGKTVLVSSLIDKLSKEFGREDVTVSKLTTQDV